MEMKFANIYEESKVYERMIKLRTHIPYNEEVILQGINFQES